MEEVKATEEYNDREQMSNFFLLVVNLNKGSKWGQWSWLSLKWDVPSFMVKE